MNQEDIIRMAREAGMVQDYDCFFSPSDQDMDVHITDLERFAALVAAAEQEKMMDRIRNIIVEAEQRGAAAEREACAQVCEVPSDIEDWEIQCGADGRQLCNDLAAAIRARGNK